MTSANVTPIKVSVVEDHDRFRTGLTTMPEGYPAFRCLGAYRTAEKA